MSPVIDIRNLSAGSAAGPILRDVSLSVNAGEVMALVGESGAGKSTIANALMVKLMEMGVTRIIARAQGETQRKILEKMGVREILSPEEEVGKNVAERLINPGMMMCVTLPDNYEIVEIAAPRSVVGRTLKDIGLLEKYRLNLVTVIQKGGDDEVAHIKGVPQEDMVIEAIDELVVFGKVKDVERFIDINA